MTWDGHLVVDNQVVCFDPRYYQDGFVKHRATMALMTLDHYMVIEEHINYHLMMGIDRIYIYAFLDYEMMKSVVERYVLDGRVVLYNWTHVWPKKLAGRPMEGMWIPYQIIAINDALIRHGKETDWMVFVDPDEYIVPIPPFRDIPSVLRRYNTDKTSTRGRVSGLAMNSLKFACDANQLSLPNATLVVEACQRHDTTFTRLVRLKTFVAPEYVTDISIHWPQQRRFPLHELSSSTEMYFNHYHRGLPLSDEPTPILSYIEELRKLPVLVKKN